MSIIMKPTQTVRFDVTVVGGGMAGVCAAIAAARHGAQTALIQDRSVLGGNSSSEMRVWTVGATAMGRNRYAAETGIIGELDLENLYRNPEGNPHIWDSILLDFVMREKNLTLYLNTTVLYADGTDTHMEAILGLWGLATKDGINDSYVYIQNGQVQFAPTSNAYKNALTTLNRWYENDLIWSECFTGTEETFQAKVSSEVPMVGLFAAKTITSGYEDHYVQLEPVAVEGYQAKWYRHPGRLGGKGQFSLTRSCENPEVLMHWIDLFYSLENTVAINYGEEADGRWTRYSDGRYEFFTLPATKTEELQVSAPLFYELFTNVPGAFTAQDFEDRIVLSSIQAMYQESYVVYEEYMTDEFWPRPYIADTDVSRLAELRTDIFHLVTEKREAWVTGIDDINTDWNDYLKLMDKIGIEEFLDILQRNYDHYLEGLE